MGNGASLKSSSEMGRKPSANPMDIPIMARVDKSIADAIDGEIDEEARPGFRFSRSEMIRILILEAIDTRKKARAGKKK